MTTRMSRRSALHLAAFAGIALPAARAVSASAQTPPAGTGVLGSLRRAGSVTIGIANQPPYSSLNADGSVTGIGPAVIQGVMAKLGVPRVAGVVAPYADLIPGLDARRWDIIGAVFSITKARCAQVLYADPLVFDGGAIAYFPGDLPSPPRTIADLARSGLPVGILTGSYLVARAMQWGVAASNIQQFPDNPSLIDGMVAKRVKVVLSAYTGVASVRKARNMQFEIIYPLPEDPPSGGSPAFRRTDLDLYVAFQREVRTMARSGQLDALRVQYGFDPPPPALRNESADIACAKAP